MKVRPLHDRVLIKRIEEQETIRGGIIIPDTAKEKPQEGEVVAVGSGKRLEGGKGISLGGKEGDRVLFWEYFRAEGKVVDHQEPVLSGEEILWILADTVKSSGER